MSKEDEQDFRPSPPLGEYEAEAEAQRLLAPLKEVDDPHLQQLIREDPTAALKMVTVVKRTMTMHSGPLPPVDVLKGYETILPGVADRIFAMSERQLEHRIALDNKGMELQKIHLENEAVKNQRGQYVGAFVAALCLATASILGFFGMEAAASIVGGSTIVALAIVFVLGRLPHKEKSDE